MPRIILCIALFLSATTSSQNPIPRQGNSCPTGTYKSGDYCDRQHLSLFQAGDFPNAGRISLSMPSFKILEVEYV
jgi:hypothetical protein